MLLTPQTWETQAEDVVIRIGRQFARLRQIKRTAISEVADQLNISMTVVEGIERGDVRGRGATFRDYAIYAQWLGISLTDLFDQVVSHVDQAVAGSALLPSPLSIEIRQELESILLQQVEQAAQALEAQGYLVTLQAIGEQVCMTPQGLKKYPLIAAFLAQQTLRNAASHQIARIEFEKVLLKRAQMVVEQLQMSGQTVSHRAIARALNIPWSTLRSYQCVREWLQSLGS